MNSSYYQLRDCWLYLGPRLYLESTSKFARPCIKCQDCELQLALMALLCFDREDPAASRMVARLRGGCIEFKKPKEFNSFLQASADDTKKTQADFWRSLGGDRSGLISVSECAGGATEEATESFLKSLPSDKA